MENKQYLAISTFNISWKEKIEVIQKQEIPLSNPKLNDHVNLPLPKIKEELKEEIKQKDSKISSEPKNKINDKNTKPSVNKPNPKPAKPKKEVIIQTLEDGQIKYLMN